MPREINYLVFSTEELFAALAGFRRSQGNPLPGDTVERLTIRKTEASFQVTARVKTNRSGRVISVMVEPHEVLSALILFCKSVGIPLALKAHKALAGMWTLRPGSRLSVTPVSAAEWKFITGKLV